MTTQIEMSLENESWTHQCMNRFFIFFGSGDQFTADDLHGKFPEPPHFNAYGNLLHVMKKQNYIEHVSYTRSTRPERNGGLIRVWRVK